MAHTAEPPKGSSLAVARRIPASCSNSACTASTDQFRIAYSGLLLPDICNGGRSILPACITSALPFFDCTKGSPYVF